MEVWVMVYVVVQLHIVFTVDNIKDKAACEMLKDSYFLAVNGNGGGRCLPVMKAILKETP